MGVESAREELIHLGEQLDKWGGFKSVGRGREKELTEKILLFHYCFDYYYFAPNRKYRKQNLPLK